MQIPTKDRCEIRVYAMQLLPTSSNKGSRNQVNPRRSKFIADHQTYFFQVGSRLILDGIGQASEPRFAPTPNLTFCRNRGVRKPGSLLGVSHSPKMGQKWRVPRHDVALIDAAVSVAHGPLSTLNHFSDGALHHVHYRHSSVPLVLHNCRTKSGAKYLSLRLAFLTWGFDDLTTCFRSD